MPIIKPTNNTAPVFYPEGNYSIVKYIDLTKFISLIQRQSLFFCRLDKLEDRFEGVIGKATFDEMVKWYKYMRDVEKFWLVEMPDEKIIEEVNKEMDMQKRLKSLNCVNCWNKKDFESAALWKIYSDFSKGIMIKSSISRLIASLENSNHEISLSEVHYIDYETQMMPAGNTMYPIIHKQNAYSYEDEVRLIHQVNQIGWIHDWTKEEVEEGIYIKTDLNLLIEEIIISPYSPNWFISLVEDILDKYGLKKQILKSKLSATE